MNKNGFEFVRKNKENTFHHRIVISCLGLFAFGFRTFEFPFSHLDFDLKKGESFKNENQSNRCQN